MSFKKNLRNELLYNDIRLKEFASLIGVPYSTVASWVDNRGSLPNAEMAVKIAKTLNVSVEYLVTGKNDPLPEELTERYPKLFPTIEEMLLLPKPILVGIQSFIHLLYSNSNFFKE